MYRADSASQFFLCRIRRHGSNFYFRHQIRIPVGTSSEEGYVSASKKSHFFGRYSAGSVDSDGGRKWSSTQETSLVTGSVGQAASDQVGKNLYQNFETGSYIDVLNAKSKVPTYTISAMNQSSGSWTSPLDNGDGRVNLESLRTHSLDVNGVLNLDRIGAAESIGHSEAFTELDQNHHLLKALKVNSIPDSGPNIPLILYLIITGTEESPAESMRGALQQLIEAAITKAISNGGLRA